MADWGVKQITFTGGEPLLYKDLFVLLKHANKQNITTGFSTNGTIMTKKLLKDIHEAGVDRITVSIDGPEDVHDCIRGKWVYKKAIRTLGDLTELQEVYGKPRMRINAVIVDQNIEYLIDMFFLAKEYGVELNFMPLSYYRPRENEKMQELFIESPLYTASLGFNKRFWCIPDST